MYKIFSFDDMKSFLLSFTLTLLGTSLLFAQAPTKTKFTFQRSTVSAPSQVEEDYFVRLSHLEAPVPGSKTAKQHLEAVKAQIPEKIYDANISQSNKKETVYHPFALRGFGANKYNGIPNDNDMAISNDGMIVSVTNSLMNVYDTEGEEKMTVSLGAFSDTLKIGAHKFDPRVIYDPEADRFIITFLAGNKIATSKIIVGFSQTNDPTDEWNLYEVPGNPLDDESWSDYPMISITKDEFFLTMNLLREGGTWQESFKQTVIWQFNKESGYKGEELISELWSDINFDGKPIRNLCPVKGGAGVYGPNMYFLSNRNFDLENDTIFFVEVTGVQGEDNTELKVDFLISDKKYGVPPSANQTHPLLKLQTNDTRVLDAFLEDNQIVFVSNCVNFDNNFAGLFIGHISDASGSPSLKAHYYGDELLEFGYPGIAFVGEKDNMEAIICTNHSSSEDFPGCGVLTYKNNSLSPYKVVKTGSSNIRQIGGNERWGDYIGIQPKYNDPGKVWLAGTFGRKVGLQGDGYGTWVQEVVKYGLNSVEESKNAASMNIYPNPVRQFQWVKVQIELPRASVLRYTVYDLQGKEMVQLLNDKTKSGTNEFVFDASPLSPGSYILNITGDQGTIQTEKFQVQ